VECEELAGSQEERWMGTGSLDAQKNPELERLSGTGNHAAQSESV
jgi:hypothetical protein